ncbi:hypothetical protein K2Z83_24105 [Oscillochloris sp. ZM17-4]|uniref:hypothetical protein n=1 Tax=Oscillochloris sp. ZM17-4 TaxID=2866714 RepID=UPI001C72DE71|nr:hypothetical protein [Oscillochloris sp. ZM17-4]MBX0330744.1 hypothetical protein [Oscillochloris sp. ZM17-4]
MEEPKDLAEAARQVLVYIAPLIAGGALAKIGEDTADTATELLGRIGDKAPYLQLSPTAP